MPVGCSPSLPVAAVLLLELLALEPADASAPVAAGPVRMAEVGGDIVGHSLL